MQFLTLSKIDVPDGSVDVVCGGMATVNHEAINKLHGLGTLTSQFSRHDYFTALCTTLHNKSQNTITSPGLLKNKHSIIYHWNLILNTSLPVFYNCTGNHITFRIFWIIFNTTATSDVLKVFNIGLEEISQEKNPELWRT